MKQMDSNEGLNLRGTKDKLIYYREIDTDLVEERVRLIDVYNDTKKQVYFYPKKKRVIFSEDEIRKFSLDKYGEHIPFIEGQVTLLNNYFLDFWGFYLNAEGTQFYTHLKRYAYGEKDYCYPRMDFIAAKMDKHRTTLYKYLDLLERYGFVYRFGVLNEDKNGNQETPLFKIRRQIPLLTKKLIYGDPTIEIPDDAPTHIKNALKKEKRGLPDILRKEHEKFVEKYMQNNYSRLDNSVEYEKIYNLWLQYGKLLENNNKSKRKVIKKENVNLLHSMNEQEKMLLAFILEKASKTVSKPSFDIWFKDLEIKMSQKVVILYLPNQFAKDWLENNYKELIFEWISSMNIEIEDIQFEYVHE